jgi:hypothetical protein
MARANLTRLMVRATDSRLRGNDGPASRSWCLPCGRGSDGGGVESSESKNSLGARLEEQRQ